MRLDEDGHTRSLDTGRAELPGRPLGVSLLDGSELVTTGFTTMLAPHAHRVRVVPQPAPEAALAPCDVLLVDFSLLPPAQVEDFLERAEPARHVVSYSWSARPPRGPWWATAEGRVSGHLTKSLPAERLVARLEAIHRGRTQAGARAGDPPPEEAQAADDVGRAAVLTPREQDIVRRIARGLSNAEIADQLYLSINSVKTYVRTAYRKMGVTTRSQAVAWWFAGRLESDRSAEWSADAAPRMRVTS